MAGEGGRSTAVDQEADFSDVGRLARKGGADGKDGQGFGFESCGMAGGEGAGQVDDGQLIAGVFRSMHGQQKNLATEAAPPET